MRIKVDLDKIEEIKGKHLVGKVKSYCPPGDYAATLVLVELRSTQRGFGYFYWKFRVVTDNQVFFPTMMTWIKTGDGRVTKKLLKVLKAFGCSFSLYSVGVDVESLVGRKVALTIAKCGDFHWNGKGFQTARIKDIWPYTLYGPQ